MVDVLDKFDVCDDIPELRRNDLNKLHIFDDEIGLNVIFITKFDTVFGFGTNGNGCLCLGHNRPIDKPELINSLTLKNIHNFYIGGTFVLAQRYNKQIWGWGRNNVGQLGIRFNDPGDIFMTASLVDYLKNDNIVGISCGRSHALALSSKGEVFGWGDNSKGQIGYGNKEEYVNSPRIMTPYFKYKVISIYCVYNRSFALTSEGKAYSWGENDNCTLGHDLMRNECSYIPTIINIMHVISICPSTRNTYFLKDDGTIAFCGYYYDQDNIHNQSFQFLPNVIRGMSSIFKSIKSMTSIRLAKTIATAIAGNMLYEINGGVIYETHFNNYLDYYKDLTQMTYKTLHLIDVYENDECKIILRKSKMLDMKNVKLADIGKSELLLNINENFFENLNKIDIFKRIGSCREFSEDITKEIKIINIFDDKKGFNILFITKDDEVFGFGSNFYGCLGLGSNISRNEPEMINELCYRNIQEIICGGTFILAFNSNDEIYGWGRCGLGQLGKRLRYPQYCKPEKISIDLDQQIIQISCGFAHTLCLTDDGVVYGWGDNSFGQIGSGSNDRRIFKPIKLKILLNEKIKSIQCSYKHSFALTSDGKVYSWGKNNWCVLGHDLKIVETVFMPKQINISNIKSICLTDVNTYFLSNDGFIYFCGYYEKHLNSHSFQLFPQLIKSDIKFDSIECLNNNQRNISIATVMSENTIYTLFGDKYEKTKYNNCFEFYSIEYKMFYKSIKLYQAEYSNKLSFDTLLLFHLNREKNKKEIMIQNLKREFNFSKHGELHSHLADIKNFRMFFSFFNKINEDLKSFYIFDDDQGHNVLFIMSDDNVFGFGYNTYGSLGFGHNSGVEEPQILIDLCYKEIQYFYNGSDFVIALNSSNQVFGWGMNYMGQLGKGYINNKSTICLPEEILFDFEDQIIQISCGSHHTLALTQKGVVFGWGLNSEGQIGCGEKDEIFITTPLKLQTLLEYKIKSIYCSFNRSIALSMDGLVHSWGFNLWKELGHYNQRERIYLPRKVKINNVKQVCFSLYNSYFLTDDGKVYFCGYYFNEKSHLYESTPMKLKTDITIETIHSIPSYQENTELATGLSDNKIYPMCFNQIGKTKYNNYLTYYAIVYDLTFTTINVRDIVHENNIDDKIGYYYSKPKNIIKLATNYNQLINVEASFRTVFNINNLVDNYRTLYEELGIIDSGAFGTVAKVKDKKSGKIFAIKKIKYENSYDYIGEKFLREVNALTQFKSDFIVDYISSWIEKDFVYIQMELCDGSLKTILQVKPIAFNKTDNDTLNPLEYFISCELFKEILQCVQYLHETTPPVIHRDLKPANILIINNNKSGNFLKICDFGLSIVNDPGLNKSEAGTAKYIAPEVFDGKYNCKADVYSIGRIAEELFEFDSDNNCYQDDYKKYINTVIYSMLIWPNYNKRPNCSDVLDKYSSWSMNITSLNTWKDMNLSLKQLEQFENRFFYNYFCVKSNLQLNPN